MEKKKNLKKVPRSLGIGGPGTPGRRSHTWINTQYTVKNVHVFVPFVLCAVTMLIFQIKKVFQVKNGLTTSLFFFFLF